ncbi:hypothetical protein B0O99DRAFT_615449 [Bisporella sp. PMI_857]|nr:hypothetical protein B0O99DRAFT_615449 [Bisporella sp. PMI_857]
MRLGVTGDSTKVDVCRIGERCTGILMHYVNGRALVLGQWRAFCASSYYCIYSKNRPRITDIFFKLSKTDQHQIVTEISFLPNTIEMTLSSDYQVFNVKEHIAW